MFKGRIKAKDFTFIICTFPDWFPGALRMDPLVVRYDRTVRTLAKDAEERRGGERETEKLRSLR